MTGLKSVIYIENRDRTVNHMDTKRIKKKTLKINQLYKSMILFSIFISFLHF